MARLDFDEGRHFGAFFKRQRAALAEAAALRRVQQQRRLAGDAGQAFFAVAHADLRQRRDEHARVGVARVADDGFGVYISLQFDVTSVLEINFLYYCY